MVERDRLGRVISHVVLLIGVLVVAFPVYVTLIASTQTSEQIVQQVPMSLLPGDNFLASFRLALLGGQTDNGARTPPVAPMLWVSLGIIVVFGGATIWFHDETFIKWKPTILYWLFAGALLAGRLIWKKNLVKSLLSEQVAVPDPVDPAELIRSCALRILRSRG